VEKDGKGVPKARKKTKQGCGLGGRGEKDGEIEI